MAAFEVELQDRHVAGCCGGVEDEEDGADGDVGEGSGEAA